MKTVQVVITSPCLIKGVHHEPDPKGASIEVSEDVALQLHQAGRISFAAADGGKEMDLSPPAEPAKKKAAAKTAKVRK